MQKCRALLIAVIALLAVVVLLLFALFRRHNTITTVASFGDTGAYAEAGDTLVFKTLYPGDPDYTVDFDAPYPCKDSGGKDISTIQVTAKQPGSCTVTTSTGQPNSGVVFYYSIRKGALQTVIPRGPGASPCRLCSPVMGGDGDINDRKSMTTKGTGSDTIRKITCGGDNHDTATVGDATIAQMDDAKLYWRAAYDWKAYGFTPASPLAACKNGDEFSSTGAASYCQIAEPGSYTYTVTLAGCDKTGTGKLTIDPSLAPPRN